MNNSLYDLYLEWQLQKAKTNKILDELVDRLNELLKSLEEKNGI